jgi:hypothetical protein
MEIFSFVFCHPLEHVDPCFEDSYEGFPFDFVENVCDRAFSALPVGDVVFGEFSLDITKEEEVTWCQVRAVSRVRYALDCFCMKTFSGSLCIMRTCITRWTYQHLRDFLRKGKVIPSNKLGMTVLQKNVELYALLSGTPTRLWILLTTKEVKLVLFRVIFGLTVSGPSPHDDAQIESREQFRKDHDSFPVMALWKPVERTLWNTERIPCDTGCSMLTRTLHTCCSCHKSKYAIL